MCQTISRGGAIAAIVCGLNWFGGRTSDDETTAVAENTLTITCVYQTSVMLRYLIFFYFSICLIELEREYFGFKLRLGL